MILILHALDVALIAAMALPGTVAQTGTTIAPLTIASAADSACVRVHNIWQQQLSALEKTKGRPVKERTALLLQDVYRPYSAFWTGYLGDESKFEKWVLQQPQLDGDPRRNIPFDAQPDSMIVEASRRLAAFAARPTPCSDWYVVYGPGWSNLGGLPRIGMVVDFLGMPRANGIKDFRASLPHEIAHLIIGPAHAADPDAGTLLNRIIEEGFASYVTRMYWVNEMTPAQALGYSEAEWNWALAHERDIWALASTQLRSRDRAIADNFRAAGVHMLPGGPGKIGYFLGYRIAEAYVENHGAESWRDLFALPYDRTLSASGYLHEKPRSPVRENR